MKTPVIPFVCLFLKPVVAKFDWGGGGGGTCNGVGSFQQQVEENTTVTIGTIPAKYINVRIELRSNEDVDIQLVDVASSTQVIAWPNGIINDAGQTSQTYEGDFITYSGYDGDGINLGQEFVQFEGNTNRNYSIQVYGFASGYAQVSYQWSGQVGCQETDGVDMDLMGRGSFMQSIEKGSSVTVGDLPAGLTDVYVRLESSEDIDIQLYDEMTPIVSWNGESTSFGVSAGFVVGEYAGVEIQYSGYKGEQRAGTYGHEYIFLKGTLDRTLTIKVLGYAEGTANVTYHWGYYVEATEGSALRTQLHGIIDGHKELSYSDCWEMLERTDQDPGNADNVLLIYSRKSIPKEDRDNGTGGDLWNREHVWAKSKGNFATSHGAGTDLHHLRASDASVNADRSSKDFDNGGVALSNPGSAVDCPACLEDADSFEPPDEVKGDVARMLFYMAVRYNGGENSNGLALTIVDFTGAPFGSETTGNGQIGKLSTLKQWHNKDPPSDEEKHRNNIVFSIQGNRNPFIDNPAWVDEIF